MFDLYLARELVLLSSNSNRIGYTHMFNLFVHATKLFKLISCTVGIRKLDMSGFRVDGLVQVLNGPDHSKTDVKKSGFQMNPDFGGSVFESPLCIDICTNMEEFVC